MNTCKIVLLSLLCFFVCAACDDDNDDKISRDYASDIVGAFNGKMTFSFNHSSTTTSGIIEVSRINNDSVQLTYKDFEYNESQVFDLMAKAGISLNSNGEYIISGSSEADSPASGDNSSASVKMITEFEGSISGDDSEFTVTLSIDTLDYSYTGHFTGSRKYEEFISSVKEQFTIDATAYTDWVYFSFEEGNVVSVSDPENDLNWDIALHRYDVKTNGGVSGKGKGGAIITKYTSLEGMQKIPVAGYVEDTKAEINTSGMPPVYTEASINIELSKWMNLDTNIMPPLYDMQEVVFVVRTANGKYAKVLFTDYSNSDNVKGHITFSYEYGETK